MLNLIFEKNLPERIEELANILGLNLIKQKDINNQIEAGLRYDGEKLVFHNASGPIYFDWVSQWNYHKQRNYALSKEPLYKALGLKKGEVTQVFDVTCGTGKDSLLMLNFGARVMAFERNPIVAALIMDAHHISSLEIEKLSKEFNFNFGDVREVQTLIEPEVIFYDPMYPEKKKKSALPRKEMQIFQNLVGEDDDEEEFLQWALENASKRVVVKRGLRAPEVKGLKPSVSYKGKSTRYDMYLTNL